MIHIVARTYYLVLNDVQGSTKRKIALESQLNQSIKAWTSGSRISPCWPLRNRKASLEAFKDQQTLLFLGPIQPAELFTSIEDLASSTTVGAWLTAGCFNVVLRFPKDEKKLVRATMRWLKRKGTPYEKWSLVDGEIRSTKYHVNDGMASDPAIADLTNRKIEDPNEFLRPALQENVIAASTAIKRAAAIHPQIHGELSVVSRSLSGVLEAFNNKKISALDLQSRMLSMNAAMSRFSSQAFAGIPPITTTECHFWIHSLLGTGSANLALSNLVRSIQNVLGESRLADRLDALSNATENVPTNYQLSLDSALLKFDIMDATAESAISDSPIIPLITYFSARDGFSSQVQTLSAPTSTLAECNSYRSNILTVTHEISHIFLQAALAVVAPSLDEKSELDEALRIASRDFQAKNHLEACRKLVVEGVIFMEDAETGKSLSPAELKMSISDIFERWRKEMQEIMVHAFDFMYFHESQPKFYVTGIWHSWCSIPGISNRVPEYLLRTLCAISANLLDSQTDQMFDSALKNTKELLESIDSNIDSQNNYINMALLLISQINADNKIKETFAKQFSARIYLVRMVRIYLFSQKIAGKLFDDHTIHSNAAKKNKSKLRYDTNHIGNSLIFLRDQLKENPSDAESIWVLHCLAFDLRHYDVADQ